MEKDQKQGHRLNLSVNALWRGGKKKKGLLSHIVGSRLYGFWEVFRLPDPQPSSCHNPTLSATPHLQKNPSGLPRITLWDVPPYSCALEEYLLCSHLSFLSFIFSFFEIIGFSSKPRKKKRHEIEFGFCTLILCWTLYRDRPAESVIFCSTFVAVGCVSMLDRLPTDLHHISTQSWTNQNWLTVN